MARGAFLLGLAVIGFIIWVGKAATGHADGSANDQIKRTVRKTSSWMDGLKEEWDGGKKRLPGPNDRDRERTPFTRRSDGAVGAGSAGVPLGTTSRRQDRCRALTTAFAY